MLTCCSSASATWSGALYHFRVSHFRSMVRYPWCLCGCQSDAFPVFGFSRSPLTGDH